MQNYDCFERCESRKTHHDLRSPLTCKSDVERHRGSSFSIDAILSKPGKNVDTQSLARTGTSSPVLKRFSAKSCFCDACHSHSRQPHNCCQKSCYHQPAHHLDYLTCFRYPPRFNDEGANELPRRCHDGSATMVQVSKNGYPVGCSGCPDCSISIQRLHQDQRRSVYSEDDIMVHDENILSLAQDMRRHKRKRTIFTAEQLDRLEHEFQQQQYVVGQERKYLAVELGLNEIQVKVWFQNRRIKWRKQKNSRIGHGSIQIEELDI